MPCFVISNVGADGKLKFQCNHDQGAILCLRRHADQDTTYFDKPAVTYIKRHFMNWTAFIRSEEGWGLHDNANIIFVNGFIKTASSWSMAAITRFGKSATLELSATSFASVGATIKNVRQISVQQRKWPPDQGPGESAPELTYDHCIFLQYYKAKRRHVLGRRLKTAAGPHRLPSPERRGDADNQVLAYDSEDGTDLEEVPALSKACMIIQLGTYLYLAQAGSEVTTLTFFQTFDPLEYVLDYILKVGLTTSQRCSVRLNLVPC